MLRWLLFWKIWCQMQLEISYWQPAWEFLSEARSDEVQANLVDSFFSWRRWFHCLRTTAKHHGNNGSMQDLAKTEVEYHAVDRVAEVSSSSTLRWIRHSSKFPNGVRVGTVAAGSNPSPNEVVYGDFIRIFSCVFVVDICFKTMRLKLLA